jgi:tetratricopeptide (TPR) repeat protein
MLEVVRTLKIGTLGLASLAFAMGLLGGQVDAGRTRQIREHFERAQQFLEQNKPGEAALEFATVVSLDPKNAEARANLGVIAYSQGDYAGAAAYIKSALKLNPTLWNIGALLGFCELQRGEVAEGRQELERSFPKLKDSRLRIQTGLRLVELYRQTGDIDRATSTVNALRRLEPTDVNVQYAAYRLYSDLADEAGDAVALIDPDSPLVRQIVAQRLIETGDTEGAIKAYREVLKIDPRLPGVHFELAEAMLKTSSSDADLKEVQTLLEEALRENPRDAESECLLGQVYARRSDAKSALAHYSRALQLQPNSIDAHVGMGSIYLSSGQLHEALAEFNRATSLDPTNAKAHYSLAQVYQRLRQKSDADREMELFRTLKSSHSRLADVYDQIRKAEKPADKATGNPQ